MAADGLTTIESWAQMMDEHEAPFSYRGFSIFLAQERSTPARE
ncbi:hypothetical protein [Streptomyces sp. NPDC001876]